MNSDQPTQLRLGFVRPSQPMRWHLDLVGLFAVVTPDLPATDDDVLSLLADLAVPTEIRPHLGVCFPVAALPRLTKLPIDVTVQPSDDIYGLWQIVRYPPPPNLPATLLRTGPDRFLLEWLFYKEPLEARLEVHQVLGLLVTEIPFVATPDAWELIDAATSSTKLTGRVSLNVDGFLEITSSRPQQIELLDLPGLFRIDHTHFGLPLAARGALTAEMGLVLETIPPLEVPPPSPTSLVLSGHHHADLESLVTSLCAYQAQIIEWEGGLGRRVFALAALDRLDAWPALIVTTPAQLWAWQRHLDLIGRSYSMRSLDTDAHLITYHDLAHRRTTPRAPAIVFDQLSSDDAVQARTALLKLANLRDTVRIDVESEVPSSIEEQLAIMEILRPVEFRSDVPVAERYVPDAFSHAAAHVGFYRSTRRRTDADVDTRPFRRSSTRTTTLSADHQVALNNASERLAGQPAHQALAEIFEIVAAGTSSLISPKVSAAAEIARKEMTKSHSCAVLTRSAKVTTLLRAMLRPLPVDVVAPGTAVQAKPGTITLVRFERTWPDLRAFDHVVVVDYPWTLSVLDAAVGQAAGAGSDRVTVLHAPNTIDDRLAVLASRRREMSAFTDDTLPPTLEEILYLVTPRD